MDELLKKYKEKDGIEEDDDWLFWLKVPAELR